MLAYKNSLSDQQAIKVLQQRIWDVVDPEGICGARGFWYDINAKMEVMDSGIDMLSHERGRLLKQQQTRAGELVVFEKQYYKYKFKFSEVSEIVVYDDPRMLPKFPLCNKKDIDQPYFIIDLFINKQSNLKFVLEQEYLDETLAALSILMPHAPVMLN